MTPDLSIYLVTDTDLCASAGRSVFETVAEAVAGGVTTVQVREKTASSREFLEILERIAAVVPPEITLLVNDRIDIVLAAQLQDIKVDGVHLGQSDLPSRTARQLLGPQALIGVSAATATELSEAENDPARIDYVGIGAVHATTTKADAPPELGVAGFAELAKLTQLPTVGIGGLTVSDFAPLRAAGAAGAAVVSAICAAPNPRDVASQMRAAWNS